MAVHGSAVSNSGFLDEFQAYECRRYMVPLLSRMNKRYSNQLALSEESFQMDSQPFGESLHRSFICSTKFCLVILAGPQLLMQKQPLSF
jgi:hypothetical protein